MGTLNFSCKNFVLPLAGGSHVHFSSVVSLVRNVLAVSIAGARSLSHCLATTSAVPHRRYRRRRRARADLGGYHTSGAIAIGAVSRIYPLINLKCVILSVVG